MEDICYKQATVWKTSGKLFPILMPKVASFAPVSLLVNERISIGQEENPGGAFKDKKPARTHARAGELGSTNTDKSIRNRWLGDEARARRHRLFLTITSLMPAARSQLI